MDYLKLCTENIYVLIGLLILLAAFLFQVVLYLSYYRVVMRRGRKERKGKIAFSVERPAVSVIICARNEEENLEQFLPLFLEQDYPDYEVIVVNDGSWDGSEEVLKNYKSLYSHLYYTNIPENSKVVSRKKLAITVGIKAAKNDILLFSDADCRPLTPNWINYMVRNFTGEREFVIGYGSYFNAGSLLNKMICYDTQMIAMQYMGFAYAGMPYMGVGRNLAYRKETFFRLKGFAGNLHIASGDDDLLINRAGTSRNTAVESSLESITQSVAKSTMRDWLRQKRRHLSASSAYSGRSKFMLSLEPGTRFLFYVSILALILLSSVPAMVIAGVLFLLRFLVQVLVFNGTSRAWKGERVGISLVLWDLFLPLVSLYLMTIGKWLHGSKKSKW